MSRSELPQSWPRLPIRKCISDRRGSGGTHKKGTQMQISYHLLRFITYSHSLSHSLPLVTLGWRALWGLGWMEVSGGVVAGSWWRTGCS